MSVADYRKKMESLFDYLKEMAKIVKGTRDSPNNQNLAAYVEVMEEIVGRINIIIGLAPCEKADQLKDEMADCFFNGISLAGESVNYFAMIGDIYCKTCETLLSPSSQVDKIRCPVVWRSLVFFDISADYSPKFSKGVVRSKKLMETLLASINRFARDYVKGTLIELIVRILKLTCETVYNVVRLSDAHNIMQVREFGFIEAVKPLLDSKHVDVKKFAMLIIVFAASEEDAKKCCSDKPTINYLMQTLRKALKSEDKTYGGYSNIELLEAFQKLAVIKENKKLLAKCGCLKLMKSVLKNGEDEELPHALRITTQLAFDKENAKWIDKELLKLLNSKFLKSEKKELRELAMELKWIVEEKTGKSHRAMSRESSSVQGASSAQPTKQQHIMISYNHDSQPIVRKLVDRLQKENFKVWVDFNDMEKYTNIMEAMASAVENASHVLVCISLKYKDSTFCQMEAEYALRLKKEIVPLKMDTWNADGWLGLLIGQKYYYDFSKKADFETKIKELLQRLRARTSGGGDIPDGEPMVHETPISTGHAAPLSHAQDFSKWDKSEVQDWCRENDIPGERCACLTGSLLKYLKKKKQLSPTAYFRSIEKEFNLSLEEEEQFDSALDAL